MKVVKGITALIIVLLILGFVPMASAERDSLNVIIVAEDKIYKIEDTILIEVRVYNKGVPVDADEIQVTLDTHWQGTDIEIEMSPISTGVYQATYQIQSGDHHAWFSVYVVKGTDNDWAELSIDIFQDQLVLDIHFANQNHAYLWPGESVTATITTRYRGDLIDVDEFTFLRLVYPSDEMADLNLTSRSTGIYKVTCHIPDMSDNGVYELEAHATYANAHAEANAHITVNVLNVWYRLESIAGNTATFTLGVSDENGDGVPNAEITITQPQELTGITNEEGTTIFSLTGIYNGIHVIGQVSGNGKNQSFDGHIYTTDPQETPNPAHHSFDVIYEGNEYIYESGSSITRSYKAYNSTIPLQNREIYYYITMQGMDMKVEDNDIYPVDGSHIDGAARILKTGMVITDQLGGFSISFTAPSYQGYVYLYFEAGIPKHSYNYHPHSLPSYDHDDELVYEEDRDVLFISKGDLQNAENVKMESDPLKIGGKTKVTIKTLDSLGDQDRLIAKWMPSKPTSGMYIDELESDWVCWVEGGNMIFLEKDGDKYEGRTVIPDFMSDEGDYTIVAGYVDGETGYPYVNHATLKEGESIGGSDDELVVLILLFAAIAFVLLALAFGAFVSEDKKSKKEELPSEGLIPPPEGITPPETTSAEPPTSSELPSEHASASSEFPSPMEHDPTSPENLPPPAPPEGFEGIKKAEDARGGEGD